MPRFKVETYPVGWDNELQTGWYGIPSREGGSVHVLSLVTNRPLCGMKPHRKAEFQWCAHGVNFSYVECKRCNERARKRLDYATEAYAALSARGRKLFQFRERNEQQ